MTNNNNDLASCMNSVKTAPYSFDRAMSEQAIAIAMSPKAAPLKDRPWDKLRSITKNGYAGMHDYIGNK